MDNRRTAPRVARTLRRVVRVEGDTLILTDTVLNRHTLGIKNNIVDGYCADGSVKNLKKAPGDFLYI